MLSSEQDADQPEVEPEVAVMELSTYLARIGFEGDPDTSLDCLSRLQAAHQHTVPYENLDVFLGRKKLLEVGQLYQMMIHLIFLLRWGSSTRRWWWMSAVGGAVSSTDSSAGFSR